MPKSSNVRFWITVCLVLVGFGVLLYFAASRSHVQAMAYDQFLAVMLTAIGVILAALALVVGLVAIFGYQKISEIAADEARKGAVAYLEQFLGGTVDRPKRRRTASKRNNAGKSQKGVDLSPATAVAPETLADIKTIARRYPEKGEKRDG